MMIIKNVIQKIKRLFKEEETGDQMRERINRQIREYNATGIASAKFYKGEWYE